ncbi:alkanesulfonate monooxygenase [Friedmanniella endophytica]|uniref:Alkanesulfonate monooxygenase n=1 Tax=Microlunatus kandeliicorticis TaxID=1759536 RepID=A0A7W3P4N9_9ACTN|nr:LLM class flavin-dependent oxidoreductase [Microlunatus kandeliicorticis]MBA8793032.1 alkanesulfonate monooxygenase [Microlunatus kandeliicorticis]
MSIEFFGMIGTHEVSETRARQGAFVQPDFVRAISRAHEDAGFDRVLIGYGATGADGTQVAAYAAAHTSRLGFLLAHRPGVVFPTLAARTFATLDQFSEGRVAVHLVTGGVPADQRREGDYADKDSRYARTAEYMQILRRSWTSAEPFDHDGPSYRFEGFSSEVRPYRPEGIPLYFGGSSAAAYRVGAEHADVYMLWGEPLAETAEQIATVTAAAAAAGRDRPPRFSISFRPILGGTEDEAWANAHAVLDTITGSNGGLGAFVSSTALVGQGAGRPDSVASQRLLAAAEKGELHDRALWTPTAAATNASGNTTSLVGTGETIAEALADYAELGIDTFLLRGFDPLADATAYGEQIIPQTRAAVARRLSLQEVPA